MKRYVEASNMFADNVSASVDMTNRGHYFINQNSIEDDLHQDGLKINLDKVVHMRDS